jgi:enoyl-[acyl-carrier-protein] reductase (NADH)
MENKNALIIGIRDEESLCYAIAREIKQAGYDLYATYQDDTTYAGVSRVAQQLGIKKIYPYDARKDEDLEAFTDAIKQEGIQLNLLVHGISYSTAEGAKLNLPLMQVTWEEFTDAIRVGAFSLAEVSGHLLDIMAEEASILAISLRWSKVAVPNFNVVSATKAALESLVRGLSESMGRAKGIRVNGISPGFVPTYSISKLGNSLDILAREKAKSPLNSTVRKEDVASLAVSVLENRSITGMIYTIDTGVDIMGA